MKKRMIALDADYLIFICTEGKNTKSFGFKPKGCWPSEGAVSDETLKIIGQHGFDWAATGENVLRNSFNLSEMTDASI